jgi:hypothetical protein
MNQIKELKTRFEISSEKLFGIDEQLEPQCQIINMMQKNINRGLNEIISCEKSLNNIEDMGSIVSDLNDGISYFWNLENDLEQLRHSIESIRSWGEGWKNLAKSVLQNNSDVINWCDIEYQEKF